jgi:hypothetical protein
MTTELETLDRILDPIRECFTPEVAARIAALRADPTVQARLDLLAEKNNSATLLDDERAELQSYVQAGNLIAVLQAKARLVLQGNGH